MLVKRLLTAGIILPLVSLIMLWGGIPLILLAFVVFTIINYEYFSIATPFFWPRKAQLTVISVLLPLGYLWYGFPGFGGAAILAVMLVIGFHILLIESDVHEFNFAETLPGCLLGVSYTGLLGALFIVFACELPGAYILWLLLSVVLVDTCSYFVGSYFGGQKLAPRISPKKTVAGAAGGLFGGVLGSVIAGILLNLPIGGFELVWYGVVIAVLAIFGDLAESLVKRVHGVKDSSSLLPGHGGLLDRVDALMFSLPVLFFVS